MVFTTLDPNMVDPSTNAQQGDLLLEQAASSSTELQFTSVIDSTYSHFYLVLDEIVMSNSGTAIRIQLSTDNGSSYLSGGSDYGYGIHYTSTLGQHGITSSNAAGFINIGTNFGIESDDHVNGRVFLYGANDVGKTTQIESIILHGAAGSPTVLRSATLGMLYGNTGAINALRIYPSAGTFTSGEVRLYGVK